MEFSVLGPIEIRRDDGTLVTLGRRTERHLLAILLLENGKVVNTESLVRALWTDNWPNNAPATLQSYVSRLRRSLRGGDVRLVHQHGGYQLDVDPEHVDAHRFTSMATQARVAARADDHHRAARLFQHALAEWRGTPLGGLDSRTADLIRVNFQEARREAIYGYADARSYLGMDSELIKDLRMWAAEFPMDEGLAERLMLALARTGRQAEALAHYQTMSRVLGDELGMDPSYSLRKAHMRVLTGDVPSMPQQLWTSRPTQPARSRVGRPEKPLNSSASPVAVFAQQLRELRNEAGFPTFRELAARTGLAATTLSKALGGERLPTLEVTLILVEALGGNEDEWRQRREYFARQQHEVVARRSPNDQGTWPLPGALRTPAQFVEQMRLLRAWVGNPSLRQLSRRGGVPASTLCDVLRRDRLPKHAVLEAFLNACGVPEHTQREWLATWMTLAARLPGHDRSSA